MDSWAAHSPSPANLKFENPSESLLATPGEMFPEVFGSNRATSVTPSIDVMSPVSLADDVHTDLTALATLTVPQIPPCSTPASTPAPETEKKPVKKRKSWGQVLPEPKTNLPPRYVTQHLQPLNAFTNLLTGNVPRPRTRRNSVASNAFSATAGPLSLLGNARDSRSRVWSDATRNLRPFSSRPNRSTRLSSKHFVRTVLLLRLPHERHPSMASTPPQSPSLKNSSPLRTATTFRSTMPLSTNCFLRSRLKRLSTQHLSLQQ